MHCKVDDSRKDVIFCCETMLLRRLCHRRCGEQPVRRLQPTVAAGRDRVSAPLAGLEHRHVVRPHVHLFEPGAQNVSMGSARLVGDALARFGDGNARAMRRRLGEPVFSRLARVSRDYPGVDDLGSGGRIWIVDLPPVPISSSSVRAAAARGEDLGRLVPAGVGRYIQRRRLYAKESS